MLEEYGIAGRREVTGSRLGAREMNQAARSRNESKSANLSSFIPRLARTYGSLVLLSFIQLFPGFPLFYNTGCARRRDDLCVSHPTLASRALHNALISRVELSESDHHRKVDHHSRASCKLHCGIAGDTVIANSYRCGTVLSIVKLQINRYLARQHARVHTHASQARARMRATFRKTCVNGPSTRLRLCRSDCLDKWPHRGAFKQGSMDLLWTRNSGASSNISRRAGPSFFFSFLFFLMILVTVYPRPN